MITNRMNPTRSTREIYDDSCFSIFFILGILKMPSSSSSDSGTDFISLKPSPLTIMLDDLWSRFPEIEFGQIERAVLVSKCDGQRAEEILSALLKSTAAGDPIVDRLSPTSPDSRPGHLYSEQSRPVAEMKVYRLDTDSPSS